MTSLILNRLDRLTYLDSVYTKPVLAFLGCFGKVKTGKRQILTKFWN